SDGGGPDLAAVGFTERHDELGLTAVAHGEDPAAGHGGRAEAFTEIVGLPLQRRTRFRPLLQKAGLLGYGRAVRALPLRPVELVRVVFGRGGRAGGVVGNRRRRAGRGGGGFDDAKSLHNGPGTAVPPPLRAAF